MRLAVVTTSVVLGAASCCCCGGFDPSSIGPAGERVSAWLQKLGVQGSEGGSALPGAMAELPLYEGATIETSIAGPHEDTASFKVVGKSAAEVATYYQEEVKSRGWTVSSAVGAGDTSTFQASREASTLTFTATKKRDAVWCAMALRH